MPGLSSLEVFAGVGNMAAAFFAHGMPSLTYDINNPSDETEDILDVNGLMKLLAMLLRVREKGLAWLPPPVLVMGVYVATYDEALEKGPGW